MSELLVSELVLFLTDPLVDILVPGVSSTGSEERVSSWGRGSFVDLSGGLVSSDEDISLHWTLLSTDVLLVDGVDVGGDGRRWGLIEDG